MFKRKLLPFCSIFFSLLLISGCSVKIDKDAKPGINIYKVDKNEDNDEDANE